MRSGDAAVLCADANERVCDESPGWQPEANGESSPTSLYAAADREADAYKWIESEKRGCDLGSLARQEWFRRYWTRYCREAWRDHLCGRRCWEEFGTDAFGQFYDAVVHGDEVINFVLDRLAEGWENLEFFVWAHEERIPTERVREVLYIVNINKMTRLDPLPK